MLGNLIRIKAYERLKNVLRSDWQERRGENKRRKTRLFTTRQGRKPLPEKGAFRKRSSSKCKHEAAAKETGTHIISTSCAFSRQIHAHTTLVDKVWGTHAPVSERYAQACTVRVDVCVCSLCAISFIRTILLVYLQNRKTFLQNT